MIIIAIIVITILVFWFNTYLQDKKDKKKGHVEEPEVFPKMEYSAGVKRDMPHMDIETTRKLELETEKDMNEMEIKNKDSRELFLDTLSKIGCQYHIEDDNAITFAYQGEYFVGLINSGERYVQIWDSNWGQIELYDIDELSRLRRAVNEANLNCATMTIYTIDEVGKTVNIHCKSTFAFVYGIPEIENYLKIELNDFFNAHQYVLNSMRKLREQEQLTT